MLLKKEIKKMGLEALLAIKLVEKEINTSLNNIFPFSF